MGEFIWNVFAVIGILNTIAFAACFAFYKWFDWAMKGVLLLGLCFVSGSGCAQTISPIPDAHPNMTGEELIFGDGFLSEWRAERTRAQVERAVIKQQLESLRNLFDGKFTEFINAITGLVKWLVVLAVVALITYIFSTIRQAFLAVAILCCFGGISVAQEPADLKPDVVMYVPDFKCEACQKWELNTMPELLKQGRKILIVQNTTLKRWPAFHVLAKSKWINVGESLTAARFKQITEAK